jgi:acyl-CoA thioesterase
MTDLERAREYFGNDYFATRAAGIVIEEAAPGYARCSMRVERIHKNALGNVMGGAMFTLADFAFAVASNFDQKSTVSQFSTITYLSAAKGDTLFAVAECIKSGRSTCFYKIEITDNLGTKCAYVTSGGFIIE